MLALIPIIGPALSLIGTVIGLALLAPVPPIAVASIPAGALVLALSF